MRLIKLALLIASLAAALSTVISGQANPTAAAAPVQDPVESAYAILQQGGAEPAIVIFRRVLQQDPTNVKAQLGLALAQQKAGRTARAIIEFERTLRLDPDNQTAMREVGRLYTYQKSTWPQATAALERYIGQQPTDVDTRWLLARVLTWRGAQAEAEPLLREVLQARPNDPAVKLLLAQVITWRQCGIEAVPIFNELIASNQLPASARHDYVLALWQTADFDSAERSLRRLIAERPHNRQYLLELASIRDSRSGRGSSVPVTDRCLLRPETTLNHARALQAQGDTEAALPIYRTAVAQRPNDYKLFLEYIDILASLPAHRAEAIELLDNQYRKQASYELEVRRARILSWMPERRMEALRLYEQWYRRNPNDRQTRAELIQTLMWSDVAPEQMPLVHELLRIEPANESLRLRLAQTYIVQQDYASAIAQLEAMIRANPRNQDARLALSGAYMGVGRTAEAQAELRKALSASQD